MFTIEKHQIDHKRKAWRGIILKLSFSFITDYLWLQKQCADFFCVVKLVNEKFVNKINN